MDAQLRQLQQEAAEYEAIIVAIAKHRGCPVDDVDLEVKGRALYGFHSILRVAQQVWQERKPKEDYNAE